MRRSFLSALIIVSVSACSSGAQNNGTSRNNCVGACDVGLEDDGARDLFAPAAPGDWTTYRADTYRTGYGVESTVGNDVELVWSRPDFMVRDWTAAKSSGSVWGDGLYFPSDSGVMFAFDRMTGDVLWETELIARNPGIHSTPHVTDRAVFIGTYDGNLHALDRETGEKIWKYKIGNVIGSSPLYVPEDNAIYISHETPKMDPYEGGGYVTKNDPRDGREIWASPPLRHWPHASVSVHPELDVVMVGANDGILHGYDTDTGEELWSLDFETDSGGQADIKTTAAVSKDRGWGILGTWDRNVYAIDMKAGEVVWEFATNGAMQGSPAIDEANGRVFQGTGGSGETMVALDLETGEKIWGAELGSISSSPAISGDGTRVVIGTSSNKVVALDAATGDIVWEFETDGPVTSSPTLVGDMIYVAARLGSLYALRTSN